MCAWSTWAIVKRSMKTFMLVADEQLYHLEPLYCIVVNNGNCNSSHNFRVDNRYKCDSSFVLLLTKRAGSFFACLTIRACFY